MTWHFLEVWALLLAAFAVGGILGTLLYVGLSVSPLSEAQLDVADAVYDQLTAAGQVFARWRTPAAPYGIHRDLPAYVTPIPVPLPVDDGVADPAPHADGRPDYGDELHAPQPGPVEWVEEVAEALGVADEAPAVAEDDHGAWSDEAGDWQDGEADWSDEEWPEETAEAGEAGAVEPELDSEPEPLSEHADTVLEQAVDAPVEAAEDAPLAVAATSTAPEPAPELEPEREPSPNAPADGPPAEAIASEPGIPFEDAAAVDPSVAAAPNAEPEASDETLAEPTAEITPELAAESVTPEAGAQPPSNPVTEAAEGAHPAQPESQPEAEPAAAAVEPSGGLDSASPPVPPPLPAPTPARALRSELPAMRPLTLPGPRNGVPDNLQKIRGIGKKNEELLNSLGVYHFGQIAAWTPAEARWIANHMAFPERIERDDWVGQAITFATGGDTGFAKAPRSDEDDNPESSVAA